jgi:hypothetical protein
MSTRRPSSSTHLTRPPNNSFRVLTQLSLLVLVLQIPLPPYGSCPRVRSGTPRTLWISEASTTGHVRWQPPLDLGWTLQAMAVASSYRMKFKLAPSRIYKLGRSDAFRYSPSLSTALSLCHLLGSRRLCAPGVPLRCFRKPSIGVFIWLTTSAILFSTRRQQQGGNAAAWRLRINVYSKAPVPKRSSHCSWFWLRLPIFLPSDGVIRLWRSSLQAP